MSLQEAIAQESKNDVVSRQCTRPVQLNSIAITGGDFTSNYLQKLVAPALDDKPVSFNELYGVLGGIEKKLSNTGLFRDVRILLDLDNTKRATSESPIPVKANVTLTDLPLFKYSSYTRSTDQDVGCGVRYLNPNFSQNADTLLVDINFNYDPFDKSVNRKVWDLTYLHPLAKSANGKLLLNPTVATVDATKWASHKQHVVGAMLGYQTIMKSSNGGAHVFTAGFTGTMRQVTDIANSASDVIRTHAGGDLKLGYLSNWTLDKRAFVGKFHTDGVLVGMTNEFAGHNSVDHQAFQQSQQSQTQQNQTQQSQHIELLPFSKTTVDFAGAKSFFNKNVTVSADLSAGVLKSFVEDGADKLHVTDRLFVGGQHSLKGFHRNAVGVKNGNDHIGGTSAFKLGASLSTTLPRTSASAPLRLYTFINAGDVHNFKNLEEGLSAITSGSIITKAAAASGVGLAYKAQNAVLDLSYNVPLTDRAQDDAKPGLALSVLLNFK